MKLNEHYRALAQSYLFSEIAHRVSAYQAAHPDADLIRLGIGDVTLPLAPAVVQAMQQAAAEQAEQATFRGYGPEQGYDFLREAIRDHYAAQGVSLDADEIFVSDGAKSDLGNLLDLFDADNTVLIPDPVYPVYVDTNVMAGRPIVLCPATVGNNFLPMPDPTVHADLIYLCSPNNPTGAVYSRSQLAEWVAYANEQQAILLFDAAYACFVEEEGLARSIYEIEGAKTCAIEVSSFSKMAGFTGTRCGWTIVPHALVRDGMSLSQMWLRRQTTKFNGVPYVVQRAAEAVFTPAGQQQVQEAVAYYKENARVLAQALDAAGVAYTGGRNSPYLWLTCPGGMDSWTFFDFLLEHAHLVGTPGAGFGACGEGHFRLTAFGDRARTAEAAERLRSCLGSL